jgi:hypothetical protein
MAASLNTTTGPLDSSLSPASANPAPLSPVALSSTNTPSSTAPAPAPAPAPPATKTSSATAPAPAPPKKNKDEVNITYNDESSSGGSNKIFLYIMLLIVGFMMLYVIVTYCDKNDNEGALCAMGAAIEEIFLAIADVVGAMSSTVGLIVLGVIGGLVGAVWVAGKTVSGDPSAEKPDPKQAPDPKTINSADSIPKTQNPNDPPYNYTATSKTKSGADESHTKPKNP